MRILCDSCKYNTTDSLKEPCKTCISNLKAYGVTKGYKPTLKGRIKQIFGKDR